MQLGINKGLTFNVGGQPIKWRFEMATDFAGMLRPRPVMDFDGDGRSDLVVNRKDPENRMVWYILHVNNSSSAIQWGAFTGSLSDPVLFSDFPVPADYDGDGKWDVAVWRINYNTEIQTYFYIYYSETNTFQVIPWGLRGDEVAVQDYDGDGQADPAVFREGTWFILQSRDGLRIEQFGLGGDRVLFGDYDGDGKADLAIYRRTVPSETGDFWHHIQQSSDNTVRIEQFGMALRDFVAPGDYDGDGKTDIAVWRGRSEYGNGTWYWHRSSDGQYEQIQWGTVNTPDFPVQGDYDGDGKTDPAIWRKYGVDQQAYFFINQSRDGIRIEPWGLSTDGTGRRW